jgi:hypothetical protein
MPVLVFYKCSVCGMTRDTFEDAERCEKSHLSAVSVRNLEFILGAYPYRVALLFPDGKECTYVAEDGYTRGNEVTYAVDKNKKNGRKYKSSL